MEKNTWRLWVDGEYYEFKSFKVYWAYRWLLAEHLEKNIIIETRGKAGTVDRRVVEKKGIYSNAYKLSCEKE